MMNYIITMIDSDGESIVAILGDANPPQFNLEWSWTKYQAILQEWLGKHTVKIGEVYDESEQLTFMVYKVVKVV